MIRLVRMVALLSPVAVFYLIGASGGIAQGDKERGPLAANTVWKGQIQQAGQVFPATMYINERNKERIHGDIHFKSATGLNKLTYQGTVVEDRIVAWITDKKEGTVTSPGLYIGTLKGKELSGVWQVPSAGQYDTFSLKLAEEPATADKPSTTPVNAASTPSPLSLDAQATAHAREHLESVWLKRGDLWYAVAGSGGQESLNPRRLIEAKGLSFQVQSMALTPADKLNGLEWSGAVACQFTASRSKPLNSGEWGNWQNGVFFGDGEGENQYMLRKQSGQWKVERPAFVSARRPTAAQLP